MAPAGFHRRDILKMAAVLGLSMPIVGCSADPESGGSFDGRVLIIGAGAAGLAAGHLLHQRGVDYSIVEAAPKHGGRIKHDTTFVDFPLPLGGEWLHVDADELKRIVNDDSIDVDQPLASYDRQDLSGYYDGALSLEPTTDSDLKFVGATWLDFFDRYLLPNVGPRITFDTPFETIDWSGSTITAVDRAGGRHEAEKVIITVPVRALQERLQFRPLLPEAKQEAIDTASAWGGLKAFVEFSEAFYPTALAFPDSFDELGQRLYYDAAHGQDSEANVLGLFSVGTGAARYQGLSDTELRDHILAELDEVFDGAATATYQRHISQDWSLEPFIEQAYLYDSSPAWIPRALWEPVDDRLFFAGEAYTRHDDWGGVHDAARSARDTVSRMLESSGAS